MNTFLNLISVALLRLVNDAYSWGNLSKVISITGESNGILTPSDVTVTGLTTLKYFKGYIIEAVIELVIEAIHF